MTDSYLTIDQASRLTGYSYAYINKLLGAGEIDGAQREGRMWKIPLEWCKTHVKPFVSGKDAIDDGYVTAREAAEITGYSYTAINQKAREGRIEGLQQFGNSFRIPRAWAETHKKPLKATGRKPAPRPTETYQGTTEYITARQAVEITGYTYSNIIQILAAKRINGAVRFGNTWRIPREWAETHKKPQTGDKR